MRVAFLVSSLEPSGGVGVVRGHAERLAAHGIEADLLVGHDARGASGYDVAVATWWETAWDLFAVGAARRAVFFQSVEQRFYSVDEPWDRMAAATVLSLPAAPIVISPWIASLIAELRPGVEARVVPNGVDPAVFGVERPPRPDGPLRVLIDGQPNLPYKGVAEAIAAVEAMQEPVEATLVALDPGPAGDLGVKVVGGLDPAGMAALYSETDVLLKLSRVEGLGLAPLEAFHAGVPCVVTPYTGHEDYVREGENGFVTPFDDVPGTAALLDRIAREPELWEGLSGGALAAAAQWPTPERSTELMAHALRAIAEAPEPDPAPSLDGLLAGLRMALELGRQGDAEERGRHEHAERMQAERMEKIEANAAFKAASSIRRLLGGGR